MSDTDSTPRDVRRRSEANSIGQGSLSFGSESEALTDSESGEVERAAPTERQHNPGYLVPADDLGESCHVNFAPLKDNVGAIAERKRRFSDLVTAWMGCLVVRKPSPPITALTRGVSVAHRDRFIGSGYLDFRLHCRADER